MSGIKIQNPPPGLSSRKYNKMHKEAVGVSLKKHRRDFLPLHFKKEAFVRYPKAYSKHYLAKSSIKSLINQRRRKNRVQAKFDSMQSRGNRAGILAFRKLLSGESLTELEEMAIVEGGETLTSVRQRNSLEARQRIRQKKATGGKNPLVKSGLLRHMALNNPAKVTGPTSLVSISIRGPLFLNLNSGDFNKREALTAFNQVEENILVKNVDKNIQKELNKIFK